MNLFFLKRTPTTRLLFFLFLDIILISVSVYASFLLRFDGVIPAEYFDGQEIVKIIILTLFFCLPSFYLFGLYSFSWSYVSTQELVSLFKAITLSFIFLGIAVFFSKDFPLFTGFPRSVFIIDYFLVFILCGGIRLIKRIYLIIVGNGKNSEKDRTLIVGAGDAGEQILRSIISSIDSPYFPIGVVDDSKMKQGVTIHGLKVIGKISDMPKIIKENRVEQLIIALPSVGSKKIRETVELAKKSGISKIKIAPLLSEIIKGDVSFRNLKNVEVEDLLGREEVMLDTKQIESFINNKVVLITGAAGSIGSELSRQTAKFKPAMLILLDQDETGIFNIYNELHRIYPNVDIVQIISDIVDKDKITEVFNKFKPNIVFHAAAYKHVPLMEENPDQAIKNNILGVKTVAETSVEHKVEKFIFISTDKAVNPTSVMGFTKRVGEMICQSLNKVDSTKFVSVRFGNVLNSRGSVIPIFREQIMRGGPVEVTDERMKRYFMLTSEACLLLMQAGSMGQGGEIFVLDMGEPVKILDLAKDMIRLSGYEPDKDIPIVFTGIRPGEKLFEEILTAEEGVTATKNQRIFFAKQSHFDNEKVNGEIIKMINAVQKGDNTDAVAVLKNMYNLKI
jgi:FlaA1/EpsC-like NDP-sugar epimerase